MKNHLLLFIFSLLFYNAQGQEVERQVIANATHFMESGNLSLNGTLGEVSVTTLDSGSDLSIGQGFHQGSLLITNTYEAFSDLEFNVFPNPTIEEVVITTSAEQPLTATIFDLTGRILIQQEIENPKEQTTVHLGRLPAGHYFMKINDENGTPIFISSIQKINQ